MRSWRTLCHAWYDSIISARKFVEAARTLGMEMEARMLVAEFGEPSEL
jgi:hypothetical protein